MIFLENTNSDIDKSYFNNYGGGHYLDTYKNHTFTADEIIQDIRLQGESISTLLDLGCAYGNLVRDFRELGIRAYGLDNIEEVILNSVVPKYCFKMDIRDLDKVDFKFDLVYSNSLMYLYPQEIPQILNKIHKICGRYFYLCVPFLEDTYFQDTYRKFLASRVWWEISLKNQGFLKIKQNLYTKRK